MLNKKNMTIGLLIITLIIIAYSLLVICISGFEWNEFGDSFGFLNTLFSGLAFLAVAYSISQQNTSISQQNTSIEQQNTLIEQQNESIQHQQKTLELTIEEMKLQVTEMAETRKELARQATTQEKSENIARISAMINAYSSLITKNYSQHNELSERLKVMKQDRIPFADRKNLEYKIDHLNEQIHNLADRIENLLEDLQKYENTM